MARLLTLITGGSAGLGAAFARCAAADGHDLVLVARGLERLEALATSLRSTYGVAVTCHGIDLSDRTALLAFCADIRAGRLKADVFVNNAGSGIAGAFSAADPDALAKLVDLDVTAASLLLQAVLPGMLARGSGKVLNVASLAGYQPGPGAAAYAAAKAYLRSLSIAVAHEVRGTGVQVLTLCPGPIDTPFAESSGLRNTWLFSGLIGVEQPSRVADLAWRRLKGTSRVEIPGAVPKIMSVMGPLTPAFIGLRIASLLFSRRGGTGS